MNKGFWNGFSYAVSYPTEIREIPEFAGELCRGIKDLKTGEMDRKHTLGFLVGGSINLTINSFESEDQILFCGMADNGFELDIEQCQRLFSLPATICHSRENGNPEKCWIPDQVRNYIKRISPKPHA